MYVNSRTVAFRWTEVTGGENGLGARFLNVNRKGLLVWPTQSKIIRFEAPTASAAGEIAWRVKENYTVWSLRLEPTADGGTTRLANVADPPSPKPDPDKRRARAEKAVPHYLKGFEKAPNDPNLISLALQCMWDEKIVMPHQEELTALADKNPGSWLAFLVSDILENGEKNGGVEKKYRPRSYDEGPKGD